MPVVPPRGEEIYREEISVTLSKLWLFSKLYSASFFFFRLLFHSSPARWFPMHPQYFSGCCWL